MSTSVRMRSGQSVVIGGLIEENERQNVRGVPWLSEFPLLGQLFNRSVDETVQTEMVVFLIPHIVHDEPGDAVVGEDKVAHVGNATLGVSVSAPKGIGGSHGATKPGSLVQSRDKLDTPADGVTILWADVTSGMMGAYDVQLERRYPSRGWLTGIYYPPGFGDIYGFNVGMRGYLPARYGVSPWAGVGAEYLLQLGGDSDWRYFARNLKYGKRKMESNCFSWTAPAKL